jgi:hypothetical protein
LKKIKKYLLKKCLHKLLRLTERKIIKRKRIHNEILNIIIAPLMTRLINYYSYILYQKHTYLISKIQFIKFRKKKLIDLLRDNMSIKKYSNYSKEEILKWKMRQALYSMFYATKYMNKYRKLIFTVTMGARLRNFLVLFPSVICSKYVVKTLFKRFFLLTMAHNKLIQNQLKYKLKHNKKILKESINFWYLFTKGKQLNNSKRLIIYYKINVYLISKSFHKLLPWNMMMKKFNRKKFMGISKLKILCHHVFRYLIQLKFTKLKMLHTTLNNIVLILKWKVIQYIRKLKLNIILSNKVKFKMACNHYLINKVKKYLMKWKAYKKSKSYYVNRKFYLRPILKIWYHFFIYNTKYIQLIANHQQKISILFIKKLFSNWYIYANCEINFNKRIVKQSNYLHQTRKCMFAWKLAKKIKKYNELELTISKSSVRFQKFFYFNNWCDSIIQKGNITKDILLSSFFKLKMNQYWENRERYLKVQIEQFVISKRKSKGLKSLLNWKNLSKSSQRF